MAARPAVTRSGSPPKAMRKCAGAPKKRPGATAVPVRANRRSANGPASSAPGESGKGDRRARRHAREVGAPGEPVGDARRDSPRRSARARSRERGEVREGDDREPVRGHRRPDVDHVARPPDPAGHAPGRPDPPAAQRREAVGLRQAVGRDEGGRERAPRARAGRRGPRRGRPRRRGRECRALGQRAPSARRLSGEPARRRVVRIGEQRRAACAASAPRRPRPGPRRSRPRNAARRSSPTRRACAPRPEAGRSTESRPAPRRPARAARRRPGSSRPSSPAPSRRAPAATP